MLKKIFEYAQARNFTKRVQILAGLAKKVLPVQEYVTVLDVGCGDGLIDKLIMETCPNVKIAGCDVFVRSATHIAVREFDGKHLPFGDGEFDYVMMIDVLHHTLNISELVAEAKRVAARGVIIKDHLTDRWLAVPILRFMDHVGNDRHQVVSLYNYLSQGEWYSIFQAQGLTSEIWNVNISLYPWWADWLFGNGLHFFSLLTRQKQALPTTETLKG